MSQGSRTQVKYIVSADGTRLYSDAVGNPSSPALVFVHGLGTTAVCFDTIFRNPQFSADHFLIRYDLRGYGKSGKPNSTEGYSSQKYAEDFAAVIKEYSATKVVFVGWSLDGTVLTDIATFLPKETLLGAVFLASAPASVLFVSNTAATNSLREHMFDPARTESYELLLTLGRLMFIRNAEPGEHVLEETIKANEQGTDFVDENSDVSSETRLAFLGMALTQSPTQRLSTILRPQEHEKVLQLLQEGFPVAELYGTADGYVSGDIIVGGLKPIAKNLEIQAIEGACHALFIDKPNEVMNAIFGFTRRLL